MSQLKALDHLTLEDGELFHDGKGRPRPLPVPLAPLADTHGHLGSLSLHDPALALARAALAGVRLLVVPVDPVEEMPSKWADAESLAAWLDLHRSIARDCLEECVAAGMVLPSFEGRGEDVPDLLDNVRVLVGAHPYGAASVDDDVIARMRDVLALPQCVGVGEVGLDYGPYNEAGVEDQERALRVQLRLAHELGVPVELHVRDAVGDPHAGAHLDVARVLREEGVPEAGCVLHCFTSDPKVMEDFAELGCSVAFGGALTFSRSEQIRRAAALCPSRCLLSETDCPYMAPVPLRGEECEPAMVAFTAAAVADAREALGRATRQQTYDALWENARALFMR